MDLFKIITGSKQSSSDLAAAEKELKKKRPEIGLRFSEADAAVIKMRALGITGGQVNPIELDTLERKAEAARRDQQALDMTISQLHVRLLAAIEEEMEAERSEGAALKKHLIKVKEQAREDMISILVQLHAYFRAYCGPITPGYIYQLPVSFDNAVLQRIELEANQILLGKEAVWQLQCKIDGIELRLTNSIEERLRELEGASAPAAQGV